MAKHELRVAANEGGPIGNILVAVDLPDDERIHADPTPGRAGFYWAAPGTGPKMPGGLPPVEYYIDDDLIAYGNWPYLTPAPKGYTGSTVLPAGPIASPEPVAPSEPVIRIP